MFTQILHHSVLLIVQTGEEAQGSGKFTYVVTQDQKWNRKNPSIPNHNAGLFPLHYP